MEIICSLTSFDLSFSGLRNRHNAAAFPAILEESEHALNHLRIIFTENCEEDKVELIHLFFVTGDIDQARSSPLESGTDHG